MAMWRYAVGVMLTLGVGALPASAATIIYRINGTVSGALGSSNPFSNAPFSVIATADTATLQSCVDAGGPILGCRLTAPSALTLNIDGYGDFIPTTPAYVFDNQPIDLFGAGVGFGDTFLFGNVTGSSSAFSTYDLISAIGPITSTGFFPGNSLATDRGRITFASAISSITFQASLASAVPEPESWAMLVTSFGAVGFAMRRRTTARTAPTGWA